MDNGTETGGGGDNGTETWRGGMDNGTETLRKRRINDCDMGVGVDNVTAQKKKKG